MDKYESRLLNEKLTKDYNKLLKFVLNDVPLKKRKTFKNMLVTKLNGAFRLGLYEGGK